MTHDHNSRESTREDAGVSVLGYVVFGRRLDWLIFLGICMVPVLRVLVEDRYATLGGASSWFFPIVAGLLFIALSRCSYTYIRRIRTSVGRVSLGRWIDVVFVVGGSFLIVVAMLLWNAEREVDRYMYLGLTAIGVLAVCGTLAIRWIIALCDP